MENSHKRVKFYSADDYSTVLDYGQAVRVLSEFSSSGRISSVSDAIELYNAGLFIDAGIFLLNSSQEERSKLQKIARAAKKEVFAYIGKNFLLEATLPDFNLPILYRGDLLELLGKAGMYGKRSEALLNILDRLQFRLEELTKCSLFVKYYGTYIRGRMLSDFRSAELILSDLRLEQESKPKYHIPSDLSDAEKEKLVTGYILSESADSSFLNLIINSRISSAHGISVKNKAQAERKYKDFWNTANKNINFMKCGVEVVFIDSPPFEYNERLVDRIAVCEYNKSYLCDSFDTESILNNLQHVFCFVDQCALINAVSNESETRVFESMSTMWNETSYLDNFAFKIKQMIDLAKIRAYEGLLNKNGIRVEEAVQDYVNRLLMSDFGVQGFQFVASTQESSYLEKTLHLCAQMESLARQFNCFVENGEVDSLWLKYDTSKIEYDKLGSLIPEKYFYPNPESELSKIIGLLFSQHSNVSYLFKEYVGDSLAEIVLRNRMNVDDLNNRQMTIIEELTAHLILKEENGVIVFSSSHVFEVLFKVFQQGTVVKHHLDEGFDAVISQMVADQWLVPTSTFLSRKEADLFSYWLNNMKFSNARALRNEYAHGNHIQKSPQECEEDYFHILRLLVYLVIKINDEFIIKFPEKVEKEESGR